MHYLLSWLLRYKRWLSIGIVSTVLNRLANLSIPVVIGWIIAILLKEPSSISAHLMPTTYSTITLLSLVIALLFISSNVFLWKAKYAFKHLAILVEQKLRLLSYEALQIRTLSFITQQKTGELITLLHYDIKRMERFIQYGINEIVQLFVLITFASFLLLSTSFILGFVCIIPLPIIVILSVVYHKILKSKHQAIREQESAITSKIQNNIVAMPDIKAKNTEGLELEYMKNYISVLTENNRAINVYLAIYAPLMNLIIGVSYVSLILVGSYGVLYNLWGVNVSQVVVALLLVERLLKPVSRIGMVINDLSSALVGMERIKDFLGIQDQNETRLPPREHHPIYGDISFRNVSYEYSPERQVFQNLNLDIKRGDKVLITGPSGSGKSTLAKMLLHLLAPQSGTIYISNQDITQIPLETLRNNIAYVSQDAYILPGSIKDNITYGLRDVGHDELNRVIGICQLDAFFFSKLPHGLDTDVHERGFDLSGGQKQRIQLARALLQDAPIVILDEASNQLDKEMEHTIIQDILETYRDRTILFLSHQLTFKQYMTRCIELV